jgi:Lar family restriction alleviation protein
MELLNCPFCGSTNRQFDESYVACLDCGTIGPTAYTSQDSIKAWNTRTPPEEEE